MSIVSKKEVSPKFLAWLKQTEPAKTSKADCFTCLYYRTQIKKNYVALKEMKEETYFVKWLKDLILKYERHLKIQHSRKSILAKL